MDILLAAIIGILFGSIPTAFLIVKKTKGLDITEEGSKNIGTRNAHRVSGSNIIGLSVLILDLLKGVIPVLIVQLLWGDQFINLVVASLSAVTAHCYSPWIKFKGGKGLAVTAGSTALFIPAVPMVWILFWIISFLFKRIVNFSNIVASLLTGALVIINKDVMNSYSIIEAENPLKYGLLVASIMLIILTKHWTEIKRMVNIK
ncbi:MAG: glycerol-3-phosphate acyltransferase [Melioribacteraceae bacterium]|nr:glycerol-3-phosphate acyltransferase [Melioribacteraceae bacterium]